MITSLARLKIWKWLKKITKAFKAEVMGLPELRKEKTNIELSEEKLISKRYALKIKLNVRHDVDAKIDLFKETCHKFLSKINPRTKIFGAGVNDPKIVTERLKKDILSYNLLL